MSFWSRNPFEFERHVTDELANMPAGNRVLAWLLGVVLPLFPLGYAVYCLVTGRAYLPGRGSGIFVTGSAAISCALAYAAVGLLLHFHWFWGASPRLAPWCGLFKALALLGLIVSLGFTFWFVF